MVLEVFNYDAIDVKQDKLISVVESDGILEKINRISKFSRVKVTSSDGEDSEKSEADNEEENSESKSEKEIVERLEVGDVFLGPNIGFSECIFTVINPDTLGLVMSSTGELALTRFINERVNPEYQLRTTDLDESISIDSSLCSDEEFEGVKDSLTLLEFEDTDKTGFISKCEHLKKYPDLSDLSCVTSTIKVPMLKVKVTDIFEQDFYFYISFNTKEVYYKGDDFEVEELEHFYLPCIWAWMYNTCYDLD